MAKPIVNKITPFDAEMDKDLHGMEASHTQTG